MSPALASLDAFDTLPVEAAEEKLVNATEEAINLMRSVLDNPEPIRNIAALVKAQQQFYAEAAEVSFPRPNRIGFGHGS